MDEPRAGVDVIVAKPVVVSDTLTDVDVTEVTAPSACVVTMTVTIDLVAVETWADVIVVLDVLEVADSEAAAEVVPDVTADERPVEVVDEVSVVGMTTVVDWPFDVVATEVSVVFVVTEVLVIVAVGVVVEAVTTEVVAALEGAVVVAAEALALAPVPACLLWNIPSSIPAGISEACEEEMRVRIAKTARCVERSIAGEMRQGDGVVEWFLNWKCTKNQGVTLCWYGSSSYLDQWMVGDVAMVEEMEGQRVDEERASVCLPVMMKH